MDFSEVLNYFYLENLIKFI